MNLQIIFIVFLDFKKMIKSIKKYYILSFEIMNQIFIILFLIKKF